ncbi:phage shock protein PspC (stress-responsive transcriptional regulator) [Actinomadura coerulea]|uniref:Phage shock protein PspC (Stress-responsive transcriptional regulator) n=1 Tax=Actinomadura coerulea TaxID=46159 RepID=A0A7X0L127_9ACTN|nr:PspC domain-containing protein [Actinomadura coerulea]MBB6397789.1 phage shock protein PspC (stress-responsive transcriptional regulator) [Actinomadura coerulea]GGQ18570.1 membrane protein [Actinomadura coerulea]
MGEKEGQNEDLRGLTEDGPATGDHGEGGPRTGERGAGAEAAGGYRRLSRDAERKVLAGVCTGLARYTGIDPVVFRVGFAILALAHGQGIFLYIVAALLMPASPGESSLAEQWLKRWFDGQAVLTILGALLCVGVAFSLFGGVPTDAIAPLVVVGLVLLVAHSRGVDLVSVARTVPERITGHAPEPSAEWTRAETASTGGVSLGKDVSASGHGPVDGAGSSRRGGLPDGMIDLAAYSTAWTDAPGAAAPSATATTAPAAPAEHGCGGRTSPVAAITLLAAMAAGAALIPVSRAYPAPDSWLIVMAPALAVLGLGLVVGGWFRTGGLATAGTVLTLAMLTTSVAGDVPRNAEYGEIDWRPTDTSQIGRVYKVGVGQGDLDLTALPVAAGQRVTINAEVGLGGLEVAVPPTARVLVDARIGLGDVRIDHRTTSGPAAKVVRTLEPEVGHAANPPVIVLRIRGKLGDVDVHRV